MRKKDSNWRAGYQTQTNEAMYAAKTLDAIHDEELRERAMMACARALLSAEEGRSVLGRATASRDGQIVAIAIDEIMDGEVRRRARTAALKVIDAATMSCDAAAREPQEEATAKVIQLFPRPR